MRFGIYCVNFTSQNIEAVDLIISEFKKEGIIYALFEALGEHIRDRDSSVFNNRESTEAQVDFLITVGGDGTILNAIHLISGGKIPVLGINTGRLGFLTSVTPAEIGNTLKELREKTYHIEERTLLEVSSEPALSWSYRHALNEISVLKKDSSSMITIHAHLNGAFLNTYWADGLIISTATGSTAYSMSCGGPIVIPGSGNFIITPIAPHNLNVRPVVIPDTSLIKLTFEARSGDLLIALDSTSMIIPESVSIEVRKAGSAIQLLRLSNYSYLETLRTKLNWGLDKRN